MTTDATDASRGTWRSVALELLALAATFVAAIAATKPLGNFPLDDDGLYARPVFEFLRTGEFHLTYAAASVRAQILWGAAWAAALGESYEVLRISTVILAVATLALVDRLLARAGLERGPRILASLAFAAHPIFFWSSTTFMTEVPFVFASALALYFYVVGLQEERRGFLVAAACAVVASFWIRQTGVVTALPPLLYLMAYRRQRRGWLADAAIVAAPAVLFTGVYLLRPRWLSGNVVFESLIHMWSEPTFRLPQQIALVYHYFLYTFQVNAVGLLPLVAAAAIGLFALRRKRDLAIAGAAVVLTSIGTWELLSNGLPFPYYARRYCCDLLPGSVLMNFGLGPPTLPDVWSGKFAYPFAVGHGTQLFMTIALGVLAAILIWCTCRSAEAAVRDPAANVVLWLAIAQAIAATLALCASAQYFDRYALDAAWPLVIVAAMAVPWQRFWSRATSGAVLALVALFVILSVGEYFAWNRARWSVYDGLRSRGIPMTQIDGGAEPFNTFEVAFVSDPHKLRRMLFGPGRRRYAVAFNQMPGYRVVERAPFTGWLGLHRGEVLALEKVGGP